MFLALWVTLGVHCGTWGLQLGTRGAHFGVFLALWGTLGGHLGALGLHLSTLGLHLGTLGFHFGALLALWGVALDPFGHFWGKISKKVPKVTENGSQNGDIFNDMLRFRGKWQTAFGLRLPTPNTLRATCFHPLALPFEPLVFWHLGAHFGFVVALCGALWRLCGT